MMKVEKIKVVVAVVVMIVKIGIEKLIKFEL